MAALDCLCVGIIVVDHLCAPIAHVPREGELILTESLPLCIGGCASNAAIDLARVGHNVAILGCVGYDPLGSLAIQLLQAGGVETKAILRRENVSTSATLIINVQGEDRRYIHDVGANRTLSVADIPWELVAQAKVLYVGGYLLMPELSRPGTLVELFRRARRHGIKTVLDVVVPGAGDHWPCFAELLPETDVFLPNTDEAVIITGLTDPVAQAEKFRDAGAGTVVITQGPHGTVLLNDKLRLRAGVFPATYVSGTGAGDAFDAGYIAGLLRGEDPIGCLRWGSVLGASCVRSVSATESVFNQVEAEDFLARHELTIERL